MKIIEHDDKHHVYDDGVYVATFADAIDAQCYANGHRRMRSHIKELEALK